MEEKKEYKILGLTRKESLVAALIVLALHAFTSVYSIYSKISLDGYMNLTENEKSDLYDWYLHYPTLFLSFFLFGRFFDYATEKIKPLILRIIISFAITIFVGFIFLFLLKILFLVILFWNQI